jgi:hypothetical protein
MASTSNLQVWINTHFLPGKQWHAPRRAFRPKAGNSTFEKRNEERKAMATVKAKEKEMKEEKEAERQVRKLFLFLKTNTLPKAATVAWLSNTDFISYRGGYKRSGTNELPRKRRHGTRNLQRLCTGSG